MAVAVLNMHEEKKTNRFWVQQLLRRCDQLNAYDDLLLRQWRKWEQYRRSTCGLHKNISRRFWLSVGTRQLSNTYYLGLSWFRKPVQPDIKLAVTTHSTLLATG